MKYARHGQSKTRTYKSWECAIQRCHDERHDQYPNYGARGISVCSRWRDSFESFYADMGDRPAGMTLDRIDTNGNYEPGNCRWADPLTQRNNTRSNRRIECHGRTQTVSEWSRETGISKHTIGKRMRLGWPVDRVLSQPVRGLKQ